MIRYTRGNLLEAPAEALVNTVNELGVMGKGVALMFREAFPENTRLYEEACRREKVHVGHMFVTARSGPTGPRWIINFPTKKDWRRPSKLDWVRDGLQDLARVVQEKGIRSVALPPLGCGNGGLEWSQVRPAIEAALRHLPDVDVLVYEPSDAYLNAPKRAGLEALTPARALIAELVRRYGTLGLECTNLEIQKLAWFLKRVTARLGLQDPLQLQFVASQYGPYADQLRHLLDGLDGSYLHCEKRLADASPLDLIWFEPARRDAVGRYLDSVEARPWRPALEQTADLVAGFESPFGMELLATVDWLLHEQRCAPTVPAVRAALAQWPGGAAAARRKVGAFDERMVGIALGRLGEKLPETAEAR